MLSARAEVDEVEARARRRGEVGAPPAAGNGPVVLSSSRSSLLVLFLCASGAALLGGPAVGVELLVRLPAGHRLGAPEQPLHVLGLGWVQSDLGIAQALGGRRTSTHQNAKRVWILDASGTRQDNLTSRAHSSGWRTSRARTGTGDLGVAPDMDSVIDVRHVSEPGLVVLDITTADEETAFALMDGLQQLWATSGIATIRRDPAQPGVRARVYADIRRTNPGGEVSLPRTRGCSAAREAVVPAVAVVPADAAPSRSRSDPPARRRHGPTVRGALRADQHPGHTRTSRLQLGHIVAVSAGQGPWEACTTSRRRTCCSLEAGYQAASQRPASRIRAALVMLPGIKCR